MSAAHDGNYNVRGVTLFRAEIVRIEGGEYATYQRDQYGNWLVLMGCSWEELGYDKEIEAAYQRYKET